MEKLKVWEEADQADKRAVNERTTSVCKHYRILPDYRTGSGRKQHSVIVGHPMWDQPARPSVLPCISRFTASLREPAGITLPVFTKKISSAFSIVLRRWAIITLVVDSGKFLKDFLKQLLGNGIDIGSGFIENKEFRFAKHSAHEGNKLFLTQAYAIACCLHFGIKTLFKPFKKALQSCFR